MKHWLLAMCVLVISGLAFADGPQAPSDPAMARFEQALAAQMDRVLDQRVNAAADRAVASLEARETERLGGGARAAAGQPAPERHGAARTRIACAGRGTGRTTGSC
jgi:hypothetical protein